MRTSFIASTLAFWLTASPSIAANFYNDKLVEGTQAIVITGQIQSGDDEKFRRLSIEFPDALVVLDSLGGALVPALEIGKLIRLRGYTTIVLDNDTCTSSCALMWLAGERRFLNGAARLGFHASYIDEAGRKVESGLANALIGHYLSQMGLSQRAVVFATKASPYEISWLTKLNSNEAGIDFTDLPSTSRRPGKIEQRPAALPVQTVVVPPPVQTVVAPMPGDQSKTVGASRLASVLKTQFRAPGVAEASARAIGAKGALLSPMAEHIRLIVANDAVVERVATELDAAKIDLTSNPEAAGTILFRLSTNSMWKGMRRMSQNDVNLILAYLSAATTSTENCSIFEDKGKANAQEFEEVAKLGLNHLRNYLHLIRRAIFAEIENSPAPIALQESQIEVAENAWNQVLVDALKVRGPDEAARLAKIIRDYNSANAVEKCEVNKIIVPEVSKMKGLVGDWFRRQYVNYAVEGLN